MFALCPVCPLLLELGASPGFSGENHVQPWHTRPPVLCLNFPPTCPTCLCLPGIYPNFPVANCLSSALSGRRGWDGYKCIAQVAPRNTVPCNSGGIFLHSLSWVLPFGGFPRPPSAVLLGRAMHYLGPLCCAALLCAQGDSLTLYPRVKCGAHLCQGCLLAQSSSENTA